MPDKAVYEDLLTVTFPDWPEDWPLTPAAKAVQALAQVGLVLCDIFDKLEEIRGLLDENT